MLTQIYIAIWRYQATVTKRVRSMMYQYLKYNERIALANKKNLLDTRQRQWSSYRI